MTTATTTEATREQCIEARLAELQAARDAIPDDGALPMTTTRDELAAVQQQRAHIDRQLADLRAAAARVAELGTTASDQQWRDQLEQWRTVLGAELLTLKSPIRDPRVQGRAVSLRLSLKTIDYGPTKSLEDSGYDLSTLELGRLMMASGYEPVGADPARNFGGALPWHGSLKEVEKRLTQLATARAQAESALASALMSDEERARHEAEAQAHVDALNSMVIEHNDAGDGLVAFRNNADKRARVPYAVEDMTPEQRHAFEKVDAAYRAYLAARLAAVTARE